MLGLFFLLCIVSLYQSSRMLPMFVFLVDFFNPNEILQISDKLNLFSLYIFLLFLIVYFVVGVLVIRHQPTHQASAHSYLIDLPPSSSRPSTLDFLGAATPSPKRSRSFHKNKSLEITGNKSRLRARKIKLRGTKD